MRHTEDLKNSYLRPVQSYAWRIPFPLCTTEGCGAGARSWAFCLEPEIKLKIRSWSRSSV